MIRDGVEAASNQAKEGSGGELLTSLGGNDRHSKPITTSKCASEGCIVTLLFTKSQQGCRGGYWGFPLSGNCCLWGIPFGDEHSSCTSAAGGCHNRQDD